MRWILALAAVAVIGVGAAWVIAFRGGPGGRLEQWHPARSGDLVVLGKIPRGAGDREFRLRARLEVPAAPPSEAAMLPMNAADREALIGAREFEVEVAVERDQWEATRPGDRLRGLYHINLGRTRVFVTSVYLDTMARPGSGEGKSGRAAEPESP